MGLKGSLLSGLLVVVCVVSMGYPPPLSTTPSTEPLTPAYGMGIVNRTSFPNDFVFGAASSAYQIEGAWNLDGRKPSVWDHFAHKYPEKIFDRSNGDVACDSYHLYKEDVRILKEMGVAAYRFSISWSRVIPSGKLSGGVNERGLMYYSNLIDELHANGIEPYVTLFHWDTPQALEEEYGGFLSHQIVQDFHDYTNVCFERLGHKVKYWMTLNEPWSYSYAGYALGSNAPGRCSACFNPNCTGGDSGTEPYIVAHNLLLAHAAAARLYKTKYQGLQKGKIGIALNSIWYVPSNSKSLRDARAAIRSLDFNLGWFMDPLTNGDYPPSMRILAGNRVPHFTSAESVMVKNSFDFIGINYYTALFATEASTSSNACPNFITDSRADISPLRGQELIGAPFGQIGLHYYPQGIRELLLYLKRKYNNPLVYITENGVDDTDNGTLPTEAFLNDYFRVKSYHTHINYVRLAKEEGANIGGYFAWSIMDNYEWSVGYTTRFGLIYVDFKNELKRIPKLSARWFQMFLRK